MTDGPKPDPSRKARSFLNRAQPKVQVLPPINNLLEDSKSLVRRGLDQVKSKAALDPNDLRALESLVRTLKMLQEMDKAAREDLLQGLLDVDDAELQDIMRDPSKLLGPGGGK